MKLISSFALATALVTGTVAGAPALAKDKAAKAPGYKLSPGVLKVAKPADDAIAAKDVATAEPLVQQAEAAATTDDDKYITGILRYNLEIQKNNVARAANPNTPTSDVALAAPLDKLIASASTPAADRGKYYYQRGQIFAASKQQAQATQYLAKAKELGYNDPNLDLSLLSAKFDQGDIAGGSADLDRIIATRTAAGQKAPEEYYRYAVSRSAKAKAPQTMSWLNKYVAAYPTPKTWYEVLQTYGFQQDSVAKLDNPQKIDLFRLMRATGALADQYYYIEYAQKVQNVGLPNEAQAVLREGLANGKIPAANTEAKALLGEAAQSIRAEGSLTGLETKARAGANGTLATQTADAYLGAGEYAKAIALYRLGLQKGGVDADTVNTRLGIALARSGDKAGAKEAFAAVKGTPRADIAAFWTTYLDQAPAA